MSSNTPRTQFPFLAAAQAQKHVTHNEALLRMDALLNCRLLSRASSAPPASFADGDAYLVKATGTGAWAGQDGQIAFALDGAWRFYAPFSGLTVYVADESKLIVYNGTAWVDFASMVALQNLPMVGVNTSADTTNKLAVKAPAVLFDNIGNGVQTKLNKNAAADTASFLFQTSYSGRAEFGLTGDDDFHIKVSADGSAWKEALKFARATGAAALGSTLVVGGGGAEGQLTVHSAAPPGGQMSVFSNGADCNLNLFVTDAGAAAKTSGIGSTTATPMLFYTGGVERARFDASGNFGIGMTPSNVLDITKTQNSLTLLKILNASAASGGRVGIQMSGDAGALLFEQFGSGYTPSGMVRADGGWLSASGAGGMTIVTTVSQPIYFGINYSEAARFDTSGNLLVGAVNGSNHIIRKTVSEGTKIFGVQDTAGEMLAVFGADVGGANAAATAVSLSKNSSTNRSLNAAGTINASGADYAEYETKAASCGAVAKGQIVGYDADGLLTDVFANAYSFAVKSTDPNLVGGDGWGTEQALGLQKPQEPVQEADETGDAFAARMAAYQDARASFDAALEAARQKVDRVAYAGKVPVNVLGAAVGDYIVAAQAHDGAGIKGIAVNNPTFEQYQKAVGRVRRILPDGRAEIAIIVH